MKQIRLKVMASYKGMLIIKILLGLAIILLAIGLFSINSAKQIPASGGLGAYAIYKLGWIAIGFAILLASIAGILRLSQDKQ